jgi:OPT oligopeptide transporter protein
MADHPLVPADKVISEITIKALILGALLSAILSAANVYIGLLVGLTVSASIPAAATSMGILRLFRPSTILENNMVQTAASAGESLAAGILAEHLGDVEVGDMAHAVGDAQLLQALDIALDAPDLEGHVVQVVGPLGGEVLLALDQVDDGPAVPVEPVAGPAEIQPRALFQLQCGAVERPQPLQQRHGGGDIDMVDAHGSGLPRRSAAGAAWQRFPAASCLPTC